MLRETVGLLFAVLMALTHFTSSLQATQGELDPAHASNVLQQNLGWLLIEDARLYLQERTDLTIAYVRLSRVGHFEF